MKMLRWAASAAIAAALHSQYEVSTQAGLFKIDFGHLENERVPVDAEGNPGTAPDVLKDWNVIPTFTFADPNANVTDGSASLKGTPNAAGTEVTWKLKDASAEGDNDVTMTILDNKTLAEAIGGENIPYSLGMTANNPTKEGMDVVYDGIVVPKVVKDDYMYRNPDAAGTETLMRFANLNPGFYNVTVFEGRTTDGNGRYGKVWVDDINGKNEPSAQNTGNYAGTSSAGKPIPGGNPRTVTVEVKAGQYLWFAEMEDNSGGISGMLVRKLDAAPPAKVDISNSIGLFKIDFGQLENERVPVDAEGNATGDAPAKLTDWNVIPTWTFEDPNANVTAGSASIQGTPSADLSSVTWKLTDFSKDGNKNVTMTILDNTTLSAANGWEAPKGQTANNPTKENYEAVYDGVVVPAAVKDDYLYRNPDTAGSELLMRFAGLKAGTYNVTAFEGRTTDGNGRFGKVWVDDINGKNEPATQNTGNYSGVNLSVGGVATPTGNPQTVTVTLKDGQYLWFAEMEDNSGGISGLIVRGVPAAAPAIELLASATAGSGYATAADAKVDTAAKSITVNATGTARFFRVKGSTKISSVSASGGVVTIKYQ